MFNSYKEEFTTSGQICILFSNVVTKANNKNGRLRTKINPTPIKANIGLDDPIKPSPPARLMNITAIQASI